MSIDKVLKARGKTHGDFLDNATTSQLLKEVCRASRNWESFPPVHREAIDMICHKLARMCSGDYTEPDHTRDIAGYATLVTKHLNHDE